jgi:catechol-2,3-dioxygenase
MEALERARQALLSAGVEVLGITDHGFVRSIYFFDPNGIRLELTIDVSDVQVSESDIEAAHEALGHWVAEKPARLAAAA